MDKFVRRLNKTAPAPSFQSNEIYDPETFKEGPGLLEFLSDAADSVSTGPTRAGLKALFKGESVPSAVYDSFGDSKKAPTPADVMENIKLPVIGKNPNFVGPQQDNTDLLTAVAGHGKGAREIAAGIGGALMDPVLPLMAAEKIAGKAVIPAIERIAELQKGERALAGELKLGGKAKSAAAEALSKLDELKAKSPIGKLSDAEAKGLSDFEKAHGLNQKELDLPLETKTFDDLVENLTRGHNVQIPKDFINRVSEIDDGLANALMETRDPDEKLKFLQSINEEGFYSGEPVNEPVAPRNKDEAARMKRAKKLGFNTDKTFYHGTKGDIKEFSTDALGASTNAGSAKKGFFFASDPSTASDYSELSGSRALLRNQDIAKKMQAEELYLIDRYGEDWKNSAPKDKLSKYHGLNQQYEDSVDEAFKDYSREISKRQDDVREWKSIYDVKHQKSWMKSAKELKKKYEGILSGEIKQAFPVPESYTRERLDRLNKHIKNAKDALTPEAQMSAKEGIEATESEIKKLAARHSEEEKLSSNVVPVRLKMENPYIHDFGGESYRDTPYSEIMTKARLNGHDSVIFKNTYDPADPRNRVMQDIVAVFEPNQIRSTNAKFDPKNAKSSNILAGAAGGGLLGLIKEEKKVKEKMKGIE